MNELFFDVEPVSKPRMTQSDKWKKRACTSKYWAFKDALVWQAKAKKFKVPPIFDITFYIPFPKSWSKKKKEIMNKMPHTQKPDIDNILKSFADALCEDDSYIWKVSAEKLWAHKGCIVVRWR